MIKEKKIVPDVKRDIIYWVIAVAIFVLGVIANYYYRDSILSLRLVSGLILFALIAGLISFTNQGREFLVFVNDASAELRKIVWPTRDETVKTTMVVAALVFATSVLLWILDMFLLWIFSLFTR